MKGKMMAKKRKRRGPYDPYPGWLSFSEEEFWRLFAGGPKAPLLLRLLQQRNQRTRSHRRQSRARLQSAEEPGEALLDDDLACEGYRAARAGASRPGGVISSPCDASTLTRPSIPDCRDH